VLNFLLPRLLPGDPLDGTIADVSSGAAPLTDAARSRLRAVYRLDQPVGNQFVAYVHDLTRGELGWSISRAAPVAQLVADRLPWTLGLVVGSLLLASAAGGLMGVVAAWRGGRVDLTVTSAASAVGAMPEFLVGMGLLLVFAVGLEWFPLTGAYSTFASGTTPLPGTADVLWHLALPALTLVLTSMAAFSLVTRGAMRAVIDAPYLLAGRARGLTATRLVLGHALPNASPPMLAFFGLRLGHVLGGALVVEHVYSVPGLGSLAFEALRARDYPVLQAVFLLGSLGVLLANLVVDLLQHRRPAASPAHHGDPRPAVRAGLLAGATLLAVAVAVAVLAPALAPFDPALPSGPPYGKPDASHLLGTNDLGQDLLSSWLWAARGSLVVAGLVALIATSLAWTLGMLGSLSRWVGWPVRAATDLLLALPALPLLMLVLSVIGPNRPALVATLAVLAWPTFGRLVQVRVHDMRRAPFVEAAVALGAAPARVALTHIVPDTLSLVPATFVLTLRYAVLAEATLAFLGLGDPSAPSWGTELAWAFSDPLIFMRPVWVWCLLPPALSIALLVLAGTWIAPAVERWAGLLLTGRLVGEAMRAVRHDSAPARLQREPAPRRRLGSALGSTDPNPRW
jgi:ABC-type dipeptide/oligopeptide/nickel transport system permease component